MKIPHLLTYFLVCVSSASAATIGYDFSVLTGARNDWPNLTAVTTASWTGYPGANILMTSAETTTAPGVSLSALTGGGTGLSYATTGLTDGDLNLVGWINTSNAGQSEVGGYALFSVNVASGLAQTVNSISFTGWRNGSGAPDTINFDYSIDGGTTWLDYAAAQTRSAFGSTTAATTLFSQNVFIQGGSSMLFRFAPYRTTSGTSTGNWHVTGLSLVITAPEPSHSVLATLGTLVFLLRRRR